MSAPTPFQLRITDIYVLMLFNFGYLWMWGKPPDTALIVIMLTTIFASWLFMLYFGRQQLKPDNERVYRLCLAVFLLTLPCNLAFSQLHQQSAKRHWIAKRNETLWATGMLQEVRIAEMDFAEESFASGAQKIYVRDLQKLSRNIDSTFIAAQCNDPLHDLAKVRPLNHLLIKLVRDSRPVEPGVMPHIIVVYPAEYSDATHRTYIIDATGVVRERDLGPPRHEYVSNLDELDPTGWTPAEKW